MKRENKGFTIIEVVLVLAIAGLIFIMVFIALPALRRNQRDQERTRNISTIISLAETYRAQHQGRLPGVRSTEEPCPEGSGDDCESLEEINKFINNYAPELVEPSSGRMYTAVSAGSYGPSCVNAASTVSEQNDYYSIGFCYNTTCESDDMGNADSFKQSSGVNIFTVIYRKESGGIICQDNNG